jgi:hypothetical protein
MSQQGGVAERRNCMLEEHVVTMLNSTHLPTHFWGKALYTYSRLLNMIPSAAIPAGTTLFEMVNKRKPDYSTLHVFGCCAWAHVHCEKCRSLKLHAKPCIFLSILDNVNKPLLDAPPFEEIDNCNTPEGAPLLPALDDVEDGLPPPDVEAPLPPLPDKSDNSDFENNAAPSTKTSFSLSSLSAASPPHMPPCSTTGTPVPSALRLAQCQVAPQLPMLPAPDLLRCSGRQTAKSQLHRHAVPAAGPPTA